MRAVVYLAARQLRARWRTWAVLVVLVAVAGGAVLAVAAGASRTDGVYLRFLAASRASDLLVVPAGSGLDGYFGTLGLQPGVGVVAPVVGAAVVWDAAGL